MPLPSRQSMSKRSSALTSRTLRAISSLRTAVTRWSLAVRLWASSLPAVVLSIYCEYLVWVAMMRHSRISGSGGDVLSSQFSGIPFWLFSKSWDSASSCQVRFQS